MFRFPRKIRQTRPLLQGSDFTTKIFIFFAPLSAGEDFDPYENNTSQALLNPKTIFGYVRELTPESLIAKNYGLHRMGMIEILVEERYRSWFEEAARIEVNGKRYQVFRDAPGSKAMIHSRPFSMLRVILATQD